jgi:anti-sigma regulatory factor (Ser/Thr protein kinase)
MENRMNASPRNVTTDNSREIALPNCWEPRNGRLSLFSLHDLPNLLSRILDVMKQAGYGAADSYAVRLALEEAAANAVKHGHGHDLSKQVRIWWTITPEWVRLVVEDEGRGFDPAAVVDPRLPENRKRPCGRGLFLMFACMTRVHFNHHGNCVVMYRQRKKVLTQC